MGTLGVILWVAASTCAISRHFLRSPDNKIRKWIERSADVTAVLAAIVSLVAYAQSERQARDRSLTTEQQAKLGAALRAFASGGQHVLLVVTDQREPVVFAETLKSALVNAGWRGVLARESAHPRLLAGVTVGLVAAYNRSSEEVAAEAALSNELLERGLLSGVTADGPAQAVLSPFVAEGFPLPFSENNRSEDAILKSTIVVTIAPKYAP